jgi:general stress protein YciG
MKKAWTIDPKTNNPSGHPPFAMPDSASERCRRHYRYTSGGRAIGPSLIIFLFCSLHATEIGKIGALYAARRRSCDRFGVGMPEHKAHCERSNSIMPMKRRGPEPGSQNARHGGQAVREKYGPEFYSRIGKKGGEAVKAKRGSVFYAEIGKKGGESTKRTQGPEFYSQIGKKGGERGRTRPKTLVTARSTVVR